MSENLKPDIHEDDQKKPGVHFKFDFSISLPPAVVVVAAFVTAGILYLWLA